jgi:hypothetical protein
MRLIPPSAVEQHYGIPTTELRRWRTTGVGPEYFQLTPKTIRYLDDYLHDWFNNPANAHLHKTSGCAPLPPRAGNAGDAD